MARKTITVDDDEREMIDVTPQLIEGAVDEDVTQIRNDTDALESDISAELGEAAGDVSYKISVFRIPDFGKDLIYLFSIPGENYAGIRERLMDEFGSGHYSVHTWKITPGKGSRLHRKQRLRVELPKRVAAPVAPPATDSALAASVQQQGKILEALVNQLAQLKQAPPEKSTPFDLAGVAALMRELREMMPQPVHNAPASSPFGMMKEVFGLVRDLQDDGKEKGLFDIIGDFMKSPVFEQAISNAQAQPQALPAPLPPTGQPRPQPRPATMPPGTVVPGAAAPTQSAQPQAAPQTAIDPNAQFQMAIAMMIRGAQNNTDPVSYADVIADALDPAALSALLQMPDPVAVLSQYNPQVSTYRDWFGQMIEALTDDDGEAQISGARDQPADTTLASQQRAPAVNANVDPGRGGGGAGNASPHEPTGQEREENANG